MIAVCYLRTNEFQRGKIMPESECGTSERIAHDDKKREKTIATCIVVAVVLVAALIIGLVLHFGRIDAFTWELYEQVERGMTYGEVCDVLDFEGELADFDYITGAATFAWNRGDRWIFVTFVSGKASMKAQINMENTEGYGGR